MNCKVDSLSHYLLSPQAPSVSTEPTMVTNNLQPNWSMINNAGRKAYIEKYTVYSKFFY